MLHENFVILGAIIGFIGTISYFIDTIKGKTKPNRVSWFLWALAPLIAFSAQIQQGVGIISLMTFMVGFNPLLIFIASFINKKSEWKISRFDIICGILSLIGLSLWLITKVGNVAIFFGIMADGLAGLPTVVKSYKAPETENAFAYFMAMISAIITILTIKTWTFEYYGFPLYILFITTILVVLIHFKIGKRVRF